MYIYYVIGFFVLLLLYSIITKKWAISTYIISVYVLSLVVSLFIVEFFPLYSDSQKGAVIFITGISLFLFPFLRKEPVIIGIENRCSKKRLLNIVELVSILLVFLEICLIPTLLNNAHVDFNDLREGGSPQQQSNFIISFFMIVMDMVSPLSFALLTIFFYLYTFVNCNKKLLIIVFLASLSAPCYGITTGGRTQMIYWLLSMVFNVVLFHKYLDPNKSKKLRWILVVFVGLIMVYIIIATISRFSNTNMGTENSLLIYMGQSYPQFNHFIDEFPPGPITLRRIFPFTYSLLYGDESIDVYRDLITARTGMDIGIFYTLLGDLFVDVGIIGMYIYAVVYFFVTKHVLRKNIMDISTLLIVNLLFLIPLQGVFYYSFWKKQVTFCAFLVILFSRYIKSPKT